MIKSSSDDRQQEEIARLRTQNRRYRELIQNLSSAIEISRDRLEKLQPSFPQHGSFEQIDDDKGPPPIVHKYASDAAGVFRSIFRPVQHDTFDDTNPLTPNPGWKCLAVDRPQIRIGFTLFSMTAEVIEKAVKEIETRQVRSRDFTPVFLTDNSDLSSFRARGYVIEYLPESITSRAQRSRNDRRYLRDRIAFIAAKWGLTKVVDLGRNYR